MPLPERFIERLRAIVPAERVEGVLATFGPPRAVGFRTNPLRGSVAETLTLLAAEGIEAAPVEGVPGAFAVQPEQRAALLASPLHAAGRVYLQNVSSQLPPLVLDPQPGERVLDLCAAPGSKTGQLAALMQNRGELVAVEKVRTRYYKLRANVTAQGALNVVPVLGSGTSFGHREPEAFDRVLLDAPCSTEGRFRADDAETTRYWSPRKVKEMQGAQQRLLFAAVQCLRPGGTLVYSTCTFAPEENEAVLARALRIFGDRVELVDARLPASGPVAEAVQHPLAEWNGKVFAAGIKPARRVLPDGLLEGFFLARLVKHASTLRETVDRR